MIPPEDFAAPAAWRRRRRDHERIDGVLAARVAEEDLALQLAGGRRTPLDRVLAPANRVASRLFLRESRRKVWANAQRAARGTKWPARPPTPRGWPSSRPPVPRGWPTCCAAARCCCALAVRGFGVTLPV